MSNPKQRILFVDDDRYFARLYVEQLATQFVVDVVYDARHAIEALRKGIPYAAAVVDVMMPSPSGFEEATHDGMSTGIWLVKEARREIEMGNIAVVLFTNRSRREVIAACESLLLPSDLVTVSEKLAVPDVQLPFLVEAAISRARLRKPNP
jgi:CheY-like chemotaxis protein